MISSRWPRPTGVMASIDLMPVWRGSFTGWRSTTPGACTSRRRLSLGRDVALAVEGLAEGVDDPAEQPVADGHREDAAGGGDRLALLDVAHLAQDDGADRLLVEVQGQAQGAALELEQLVDGGVGQARDAGDAVADLDDVADPLLVERWA